MMASFRCLMFGRPGGGGGHLGILISISSIERDFEAIYCFDIWLLSPLSILGNVVLM